MSVRLNCDCRGPAGGPPGGPAAGPAEGPAGGPAKRNRSRTSRRTRNSSSSGTTRKSYLRSRCCGSCGSSCGTRCGSCSGTSSGSFLQKGTAPGPQGRPATGPPAGGAARRSTGGPAAAAAVSHCVTCFSPHVTCPPSITPPIKAVLFQPRLRPISCPPLCESSQWKTRSCCSFTSTFYSHNIIKTFTQSLSILNVI